MEFWAFYCSRNAQTMLGAPLDLLSQGTMADFFSNLTVICLFFRKLLRRCKELSTHRSLPVGTPPRRELLSRWRNMARRPTGTRDTRRIQSRSTGTSAIMGHSRASLRVKFSSQRLSSMSVRETHVSSHTDL